MSRTAHLQRETKETKVDLTLDLDGTGTARADTGHPVLRPHARTARQARRLRPHDRRRGRPRDRPPPHRRGRRHRARHRGEGGARRQGGRPAVRVGARAARRSARAGRARPVGPPVPRLRGRSDLGVDRYVRSAAHGGVLARASRSGRDHAAPAVAVGHATVTTSSRRRSRASPARCATRCASRGRACRRPRARSRPAASVRALSGDRPARRPLRAPAHRATSRPRRSTTTIRSRSLARYADAGATLDPRRRPRRRPHRRARTTSR